jgi:hypothetical protein
MFEPAVREIVQAAFERLRAELAATTYLGNRVLPWMERLAHSEQPESYFEHPFAYPILELPLWALKGFGRDADREFAVDVTLSNLCGYYLIRLLDDAMDADGSADLRLLGAAVFFQVHLQRPYHRYFEAGHPFWDVFAELCTVTADVTLRDADLDSLTREEFVTVASRKVGGAKIPVAAVCFRHRREAMPAWLDFVDRLGPPHQMLNDVMGWHKDLTHGHATYLLSEGRRRVGPDGAIAGWVIQSGFDWGLSQVAAWVGEARETVPAGNPQARRFLDTRLETVASVRESVAPGLEGLRAVLERGVRPR